MNLAPGQSDSYENHGIYGVNPFRNGEQNILCPQPACRERKKNKIKTLRVNADKRVWHCAHCGWSDGLRDTNHNYNAETPKISPVAPRMEAPKIKPKNSLSELNERHKKWLSEERGISDDVITEMKVCSLMNFAYEKGEYKAGNQLCLAFPYMRSGELINIKYRASGKRFMLYSGAELIAYNQDCLLTKPKMVVIVEGEVDVLSILTAGIKEVISPPNGANLKRNNLEWLDKIYDMVDACDEIILAVDNDEAGEMLKADLIRRFSPEKIRVTNFPKGCKDSNEVLLSYGPEVLREVILNSQEIPIEGIITEEELYSKAIGIYENGLPSGVKLGWSEFDELCQWLRGEFVVITGIPSHGKSVLFENIMTRLSRFHQWKHGVWVAESEPEHASINLIQMYSNLPIRGEGRMSKDQFAIGMDFVNQHFNFFNVAENVNTLDAILEKGTELVRRKGIDNLYIDPWSYVEKDKGRMTDAEYFEHCLPKIRKFRMQNRCMLTIVAHPRKMTFDAKTGSYPIPTAYDISGSNQWYGAPDKVLSIYCNFGDDKKPIDHDVHIQKQKKWWLGDKGIVKFALDKKTGIFTEYNQTKSFEYERTKDISTIRANDDIIRESKSEPDDLYGSEDAPF